MTETEPPVSLRRRKSETDKTGVVYVDLAVQQNATAPSPIPFSGFIDTRGSKQVSVFTAPNSLNLCSLRAVEQVTVGQHDLDMHITVHRRSTRIVASPTESLEF